MASESEQETAEMSIEELMQTPYGRGWESGYTRYENRQPLPVVDLQNRETQLRSAYFDGMVDGYSDAAADEPLDA